MVRAIGATPTGCTQAGLPTLKLVDAGAKASSNGERNACHNQFMEPVDNVAPGGVSTSAVMIWRTPHWARNLDLCVMALMAFLGVFIAFTADVIWAIGMPIA